MTTSSQQARELYQARDIMQTRQLEEGACGMLWAAALCHNPMTLLRVFSRHPMSSFRSMRSAELWPIDDEEGDKEPC